MRSRCSWSAQVAQHFNAAASEYDANARIQQQAAAALSRYIERHVGNSIVQNGLEIGCGTGFLTRLIFERWPDARWLITDIAPDMIRKCEQAQTGSSLRRQFAVDDGQTIDVPANSLDLIVSNLTFQWFSELANSAFRLLKFLRPGGLLIFSTLGHGTFGTARQFIESAFYEYPTRAQLIHDLNAANARCYIERNSYLESVSDLRCLLRRLGSIGAGTPAAGRRIRPSLLRRAIRTSAAQSHDLVVEYEVLFVAMQKC